MTTDNPLLNDGFWERSSTGDSQPTRFPLFDCPSCGGIYTVDVVEVSRSEEKILARCSACAKRFRVTLRIDEEPEGEAEG